MKILLVTAYFPPEIRSAANLLFELGESLARRGHHVAVVTTFPPANMEADDETVAKVKRYQGRRWSRERMGDVEVLRVQGIPFNKAGPSGRAVGHLALSAALTLAGLRSGRPDVIWAYLPPLTLGLTCSILGALWRVPFVSNVQDLYPKALADLGLVTNRAVLRLMEWIATLTYRRAAHLVVHSEGNLEYLCRRGVPRERVSVVPNWVDSAAITPRDRLNGFRKTLGIGDKLLVLYAGVMGYAQDMDVIVDAAHRLSGRDDVVFVLVGDGVRKADAQAKVQSLQLSNVIFLPLQAPDVYSQLVSAADMALVTLRREVATPVVPAKTLSIMAAARPVVAALPAGNDTIGLIEAARCGVWVPAGNGAALAGAILGLCEAPDRRERLGLAGRRYVMQWLDREVVIKQCEQVMATAVETSKKRA